MTEEEERRGQIGVAAPTPSWAPMATEDRPLEEKRPRKVRATAPKATVATEGVVRVM
jgi:hypothetical protein